MDQYSAIFANIDPMSIAETEVIGLRASRDEHIHCERRRISLPKWSAKIA
jgi:hypothetical protein